MSAVGFVIPIKRKENEVPTPHLFVSKVALQDFVSHYRVYFNSVYEYTKTPGYIQAQMVNYEKKEDGQYDVTRFIAFCSIPIPPIILKRTNPFVSDLNIPKFQ